jgi:hypothetical protein
MAEPNIIENPPIQISRPPEGAAAGAPPKEINVSQIPPSATPPAAVKPGSVREGVLSELRKRAKPDPQSEPVKPDAPPEGAKLPEGKEGREEAVKPDSPGEQDKKSKASPWKLVEEYKAKAAALEKQIAELNGKVVPEERAAELQKQAEAKEAKLKELEQEVRYANYQKSSEFKEKYQKPYDDAWKRAMSELSEITVDDGAGGERNMSPQDLLELVNLPLRPAREEAEEKYGPGLANDIMVHRKEIRRLFDEQTARLEQVRKEGLERDQQVTETAKKQFEEISADIRKSWTSFNDQAIKDEKIGKYFSTIDGDQEGNQRLAKGFELADRALSESPLAPGLTPEQRRAIVQRHAAVRNRAAAFGRLVHQNNALEKTVAELKKELSQYKSSEPPAGGSQPAAKETGKGGMAGLMDELRKRAK